MSLGAIFRDILRITRVTTISWEPLWIFKSCLDTAYMNLPSVQPQNMAKKDNT